MPISNEERDRYQSALQRAAMSKAFDRMLHILTIIIFIVAASYVVYQQKAYQDRSARTTVERTAQLKEIQADQVAMKDYVGCLKRLPSQPLQQQVDACKKATDR